MSWLRDLFRPAPRPMLPDLSTGPQVPEAQPQQRADTAIKNTQTSFGMPLDRGGAGRPSLTVTNLTRQELTSTWKNNGYARRVVSELPADATRKGWVVKDGEDQPVEAVTSEFNRLDVRNRLRAADTWARLYGTALLLLVVEEQGLDLEDMDLEEPLDPERVTRLVNLVVLDRREFEVAELVSSPADPEFRRPAVYSISPTGSGFGAVRVHHTRVLRLDGAELPPSEEYQNQGVALSIVQTCWDQIRNRVTIDQAAAIQSQQMSREVVKTPALNAQTTADTAANFWARIQQIAKGQSALNMTLLGDGEEYAQHTNNPTGFTALDELTRNSLQAVTGYPASRLFGSAPGGLSSDDANGERLWHQVVHAYQQVKYEPHLRRVLEVLVLASESEVEGNADDMVIEFAALGEPTAKEQAEVKEITARTDATYIREGVLAPDHVGRSRFRETGYSTDTLPWDQSEYDNAEADAEREAMEAAEAERLRLEAAAAAAGEDPDAEPAEDPEDEPAGTEPREDAELEDPVRAIVWIEYKGEPLETLLSLRERAEAVVGPMSPVDPMHTTVLNLGEVERDDVPELLAVVQGVAEKMDQPPAARGRRISLFPPHPTDGVPVVLEHSGTWGVEVAHDRLLRALAHMLTKRQFPEFRAHSTLGYVPEQPTAEQTAALYALVDTEDRPVLHWGHLTLRVTEQSGASQSWEFKVG